MIAHTKRLTGLTVLVVEDNYLIADAIKDALETEGCEVMGPVAHLDRGLRLAQDSVLDGALLDINLAGVYCFPIAAALDLRNIPFLFLSGYAEKNAVPAEFRSTRFVSKPFSPTQLVRVVAETCGRSERARA